MYVSLIALNAYNLYKPAVGIFFTHMFLLSADVLLFNILSFQLYDFIFIGFVAISFIRCNESDMCMSYIDLHRCEATQHHICFWHLFSHTNSMPFVCAIYHFCRTYMKNLQRCNVSHITMISVCLLLLCGMFFFYTNFYLLILSHITYYLHQLHIFILLQVGQFYACNV